MNIVCMGDSLTYGVWVSGSPEKNLTTRLSEKYPEITFINKGINGDYARLMINRKEDPDEYNPYAVIVWIGINDVSWYLNSTASEIIGWLTTLYTYYKSKGYKIWAFTITPRDDDDSNENTKRYAVNDWIRANSLEVDNVIDTWEIIRDPSDITKRLPSYADPYTPNHITDAAYAEIVNHLNLNNLLRISGEKIVSIKTILSDTQTLRISNLGLETTTITNDTIGSIRINGEKSIKKL